MNPLRTIEEMIPGETIDYREFWDYWWFSSQSSGLLRRTITKDIVSISKTSVKRPQHEYNTCNSALQYRSVSLGSIERGAVHPALRDIGWDSGWLIETRTTMEQSNSQKKIPFMRIHCSFLNFPIIVEARIRFMCARLINKTRKLSVKVNVMFHITI